METEKTKAFYASLPADYVCDCAYCRNYVRHIAAAYPRLAAYLRSLGVDIEKPWETMPLDPDARGEILYIDTQYIVPGDKSGFAETVVEGVDIGIAESYPPPDIEEEFFVIELRSLSLPWTEERQS